MYKKCLDSMGDMMAKHRAAPATKRHAVCMGIMSPMLSRHFWYMAVAWLPSSPAWSARVSAPAAGGGGRTCADRPVSLGCLGASQARRPATLIGV